MTSEPVPSRRATDRGLSLRVALVGYGYWGPNLLRVYHQVPTTRVTTVCDLRQEALDTAGARYPDVRVTRDVAAVLSDAQIDAVLIATPISTHYPLAKAALEAGKHVFVEKPMTADTMEACDLV